MSDALRIIPLGGLGEVGKNMTVYETGGELLVVDAGLAFPRDEHLGVDLLLPDVGYLEGRRVRAVVLTHGHEDHVGGLPYLLREIEVETVVATRLTLGLIKSKLDEHGLSQAAELVEGDPEAPPLELGPFRVELVRMAHSIPDSVALVIETAAGRVVHTGDWKLDHTPVDGLKTDVGKQLTISGSTPQVRQAYSMLTGQVDQCLSIAVTARAPAMAAATVKKPSFAPTSVLIVPSR